MHLVFKDKFGEYMWHEKFEVESLEAFVEKRNKRMYELGAKRPLFYVDSPNQVSELTRDGKAHGTYHLCEKDITRLI
jgi:hypothetical protein